MIYLDNAATTFPKPEEVYQILDKANRNAFNSGRGSYRVARESTTIIDNVREKILNLNNIQNGKVVFSSSATQSLNSIFFGIDFMPGDNVYISPFEHNSVIRPLEKLKKQYELNIITLPFDADTWKIDEDKVKDLFIMKKPKCIILSHVSNSTGYILPYQKVFSLSTDSINILDSAQAYGIIDVEIKNVSYIVFAGHKSLYASFGIAGYIKLKDDVLKHTLYGGTGSDTMNPFMAEYEAGSPNIVGINGLNESISWLEKNNVYDHEKELTNYLIKELKTISKCFVYIPTDYSSIFGIVSFNIDGYMAEDVGRILDEEFDICVRTGFHCAPLIHNFIDSLCYNGTVRISLGYFNSKQDIDSLISALKSI